MSTAIKTTQSGPQTAPVAPSPMNKPMHPHQSGAPATYGQPSTHMPQNLVNMSVPSPAHNYINVPNAYNANVPQPIPPSNHPVASNQSYSPPKNFPSNFPPNLGGQPPQGPPEVEKPHSNGTPEQSEPNHVPVPPVPPKDAVAPASPEKPKQSPEKPPTPVSSLTDESSNETKQPEENAPDVIDSSSSASMENYGMDVTSNSSTAENKTEEADVPAESPNTTGETEKPAKAEEAKVEAAEVPPAVEEPGSTPSKEQVVTPKSNTKPSVPRTPSRKSKTPKVDTTESPKTSKPEKFLALKSPSSVKRARTKTQPYQSPLPELEIISKMSTYTPKKKDNDEKLIIFYKNEFLAVRNSEGSFYICQAVQHIYKNTTKIKIRWLSQDNEDKSGEIYTPDFYDTTDFDCILTNLDLTRVDKGKFRLPGAEKVRTDNILKRALAVEKGETVPPSPTEEHPDGLDLSLYKEESQLQKGKSKKRRASSPLKADKKSSSRVKKSPDQSKVKKVAIAASTPKPKAKTPRKVVSATPKKAVVTPTETKKTPASASRSERAKRRQDTTTSTKISPVVDAKKAKALAKVIKKVTKVATPAKTAPVKKETKAATPTIAASKPTKTPAKRQKAEMVDSTPQRKTKRTRK